MFDRIYNAFIIMAAIVAIPFIALYMWIRHPAKCIEEAKRMWNKQ